MANARMLPGFGMVAEQATQARMLPGAGMVAETVAAAASNGVVHSLAADGGLAGRGGLAGMGGGLAG